MTTFAKPVFSAASYAAFRPTWPKTVFDQVFNYHNGPKKLCIDLGCGHGSFTRGLSSHFTRVVGIDPSAPMIRQAISSTIEENISFQQGNAEDLDFINDGSVDMIISSQAAHWFDYRKVWPMLQRKMRAVGTLAFLGYKENVFVKHSRANEVLSHYLCEPRVDLMGPYWEQPGRDILRNNFQIIIPPGTDFEDIQRWVYEPGIQDSVTEARGERVIAFYGWQAAHPGQKLKAEGGKGDVIDEMFEKMLEAEPEWKSRGADWRDIEAESEWGTVRLVAQKK